MIYDLPKEVMDGLKKARREDFSKRYGEKEKRIGSQED